MGDEPKLAWHRGVLAASFTINGRRFRRSLGTTDKAIARARLAEFSRQLQAPEAAGPITVAAIYHAYVADRGEAGKTTGRMHDAWRRLAPTFGELLPASVTKKLCFDYVNDRRNDGVSDGTIHLELGYLRAAFTLAEREKWIGHAPYIPLPQKPPPRDLYITKTQAPALIDAAMTPHSRLFIILALCTAGRSQAILDLTWDRVNFDARRIDLRDPMKAKTPKGRALIPMNETAYLALVEAKKAALSPYVIEWAGDRVGSVKKAVGQAGHRAGLKVTPHILRHSAAVWMAEDGVPMEQIAQYLGHTNPAITFKVYARYSPDYLQKAAKSLNIGL